MKIITRKEYREREFKRVLALMVIFTISIAIMAGLASVVPESKHGYLFVSPFTGSAIGFLLVKRWEKVDLE